MINKKKKVIIYHNIATKMIKAKIIIKNKRNLKNSVTFINYQEIAINNKGVDTNILSFLK